MPPPPGQAAPPPPPTGGAAAPPPAFNYNIPPGAAAAAPARPDSPNENVETKGDLNIRYMAVLWFCFQQGGEKGVFY